MPAVSAGTNVPQATDAVTDANTSILPANQQSGDLQIQIGGAGTPKDIPITAGSNDTLTTLANYINAQNWGLSATILNDASGARIAIFSQNTGSTGALAVAANTTSLNFNAPVGGTDATFTVDNIPFSSNSNTVSGAIPGVTLNLLGAFPTIPVQLSVGLNTTQAAQAITSFVTAYNSAINDINQQFTLADGTYSVGSGAISSLAALGISTNNDGTLSVDAAQLSNVLTNNPSEVLNFFQNSSQSGFANNFASDLQNLTDPTQGVISLEVAQNQQQQLDLTNTISDFQDQITSQQQQLTTEFSQVNALIESYPFTIEAIDLQLGIQPSGNNNTSPAGGASSLG